MDKPPVSIDLKVLFYIVALGFGVFGFGVGLSVSFFFVSRSLDMAREYQALTERYMFDLGRCTVYLDHYKKSLAAANSRDVRIPKNRRRRKSRKGK